LSLKTKLDDLLVVWPQNHWDSLSVVWLQNHCDGFLQFGLKTGCDGFSRFGFKTCGDGFPGLASKPRVIVSQFGHQNRQLRFGDLGLKITATVS
jgi:hypothetical protein